MTPEDQAQLLAQLKRDEGCKLYAYADSLGYLTIGYGRMIDHRKNGQITAEEALYLLNNDITKVEQQLLSYTWYSIQDGVRQAALANMAFNLGLHGLLHFPNFLAHMAAKDYPQAIACAVNTPWHQQVGLRADRIFKLIETGSWT